MITSSEQDSTAWWGYLLVTALAVLSLAGCSTSRPPYVVSTKVLSAKQYSSVIPPEVHVRFASPDEIKQIVEFPGKKEQERAARMDSAGSLLFAPALVLFFWPDILLDCCKKSPDAHKQQLEMKEALAHFATRLTKAIEQRFQTAPTSESQGRLEIVYFADVMTIGPAGDTVSFVFHARVTLQSQQALVYQEIIRIDPRAYSDDIQRPVCTKSPARILQCVDEVVPAMIQTRLPGLPWKMGP